MYQIKKAKVLADKIYLMDVEAPRVAQHCEPGQFVIVKIDEKGERVPLTICDYDREAGTVTIVFQALGASTQKMALLKEGDAFRDFVGPLGCASEFVNEDLEELKQTQFVHEFESGVVLIIHWKVHNYIQKDRYRPTSCTEEKNQVELVYGSAYVLK